MSLRGRGREGEIEGLIEIYWEKLRFDTRFAVRWAKRRFQRNDAGSLRTRDIFHVNFCRSRQPV